MSDIIDRQAILKHIEKIRHGLQMMDDTHRASIVMNGMHLCEEAVKNQPSVQPEIIRCKDCKYKNVYRFPPEYNERDYCEKHDMVVDGANFCSWAERRIDETD